MFSELEVDLPLPRNNVHILTSKKLMSYWFCGQIEWNLKCVNHCWIGFGLLHIPAVLLSRTVQYTVVDT